MAAQSGYARPALPGRGVPAWQLDQSSTFEVRDRGSGMLGLRSATHLLYHRQSYGVPCRGWASARPRLRSPKADRISCTLRGPSSSVSRSAWPTCCCTMNSRGSAYAIVEGVDRKTRHVRFSDRAASSGSRQRRKETTVHYKAENSNSYLSGPLTKFKNSSDA
jgi:hypothetical protein